MFLCRSSTLALCLRRVQVTGPLQPLAPGAASRHYRRVTERAAAAAAASHARGCCVARVGWNIQCRSVFDATPRRKCSAATRGNRIMSDADHELESVWCVAAVRTRRFSTAPERADTESLSSGASAKGPGSDEKPSKTHQLRKVFKEYGAVAVSFHVGISLISLGIFYLAVSSGVDMASVLCKLGFSESVVQSKMAAGTSTFVLAYAVHKLFAPVRMSITLVSVPLIVRHLRKTGLFKPRASAP